MHSKDEQRAPGTPQCNTSGPSSERPGTSVYNARTVTSVCGARLVSSGCPRTSVWLCTLGRVVGALGPQFAMYVGQAAGVLEPQFAMHLGRAVVALGPQFARHAGRAVDAL